MNKKRVIAAMSGGVDSSVAAAILQEKGYEVIGITMQLWPKEEIEGDEPVCCGIDAIESARRVCHNLGIPHYVVDYREVFRRKVIEDFYTEYKRGRTPNPCIRCNQHIKFDALLNKAKALGADFISTGHYARVEFDPSRKRYILKKALKEKNDQSYVLYTLMQEQLSHVIFPLGELRKEEVREYARKKGFANSERKSSQEICFTGAKDYRFFLKKYIEGDIMQGEIVNRKGDVLGSHKGLPFYTIGQREGLGISFKEPLYVLNIDRERNRLIVGTQDESYNSEFTVSDINLILCEKPDFHLEAKVKIRYQHKASGAEIMPLDADRYRVVFKEPQRAITPGQAAVFYENDTVVGGGTIEYV